MSERPPNPSYMTHPPAVLRRITSAFLSRMIDPANVTKRRAKIERQRIKSKQPHIVEYFHQLDDPYSHLTAQILTKLVDRYDIDLKVTLIRAAGDDDQPEPDQLATWARTDVELIAPHLGLEFQTNWKTRPTPDIQGDAAQIVTSLSHEDRVKNLGHISTAIWSGSVNQLNQFKSTRSVISPSESTPDLDSGTARIKELGHYSGGTFYYGGEWYWGIDRLTHIEKRLSKLGVKRSASDALIAPRPNIDLSGICAKYLTLDFYCSLNSPYSAIVFDQIIQLKDQIQCQFNLKPVLPMVMRGIPASRRKATYIMIDAERESDAHGSKFGPLVLPIGKPTEEAYSLLNWLSSSKEKEALLSSLFREAFIKATPLHTTRGMRKAVESAGINWSDAKMHLHDDDWKSVVQSNQSELSNELHLWGVPSYRLRDEEGKTQLVAWGQDRLWLLKSEIKRLCE